MEAKRPSCLTKGIIETLLIELMLAICGGLGLTLSGSETWFRVIMIGLWLGGGLGIAFLDGFKWGQLDQKEGDKNGR